MSDSEMYYFLSVLRIDQRQPMSQFTNHLSSVSVPEVSFSVMLTWSVSYQVGTSGLPYYNLTYIVQRSIKIGKPIIAASINYRKGGWGNMYSIEIQARLSVHYHKTHWAHY